MFLQVVKRTPVSLREWIKATHRQIDQGAGCLVSGSLYRALCEGLSSQTIPPVICSAGLTVCGGHLAFADKVHSLSTMASHGRNMWAQQWPGDLIFPFADSRGAGDGARRGTRASHPAQALEEEPRGAQFQTASENARRSDHHAGWATQAPGPAAEPHHCTWSASDYPTAAEGQGGEEEQEKEEHEKIPAHRGDSQSLPSSQWPSIVIHRTACPASRQQCDARGRGADWNGLSWRAENTSYRPPLCQRIYSSAIYTKPQQHRARHILVALKVCVGEWVWTKHQHSSVNSQPALPKSLSGQHNLFFSNIGLLCMHLLISTQVCLWY